MAAMSWVLRSGVRGLKVMDADAMFDPAVPVSDGFHTATLIDATFRFGQGFIQGL